MKCPYCERDSRVIDSRPIAEGIRRRRECTGCGRRFTTHERLAPVEVRVEKAGGRGTEEFAPEKVARAVGRVGLPGREAGEVARRVEMELVDARRHAVRSGEIAGLVHRLLSELDPEAARRFAADYVGEEGEVVFDRGAPEGEERDEEQIGLF